MAGGEEALVATPTSAEEQPSRRLPPALVVAFGLLLATGLFFRFADLGHDLVWHDEVYTQIFASGYGSADWQARFFQGEVFRAGDVQHFLELAPGRSGWDTLGALARDEPQHPPLYYALTRGWRGLFGESTSALRALSACASVVGLALFYWLALELFRHRRVAILATSLMACSPFFVLYAREAREYALFTAWIIGASAALLRALRLSRGDAPKARRGRAWALYALLLTLSFYTSLSMAGVALAHAIVVAVETRRSGKRVLWLGASAFAASGVLCAPWAWALGQHWQSFRASMAWSSDIHIPRTQLLSHFGLSLSLPFFDFWAEPDSGGALVAIALCALGLAAAIVACWHRADGPARAMLASLLLVPISMFLLPDLVFGGIRSLSTRYLSSGLIALELSVACALAMPGRAQRMRWALAALVLALGFASVGLDHGRDATWNKGISRALPQVATALEGHGDALVIASREQHHPGNLLALASELDPNTRVLFAPYEGEFVIPASPRPIYLFTLNPLLREFVERSTGLQARPLVQDLYADLWVLEPADTGSP